MKTLWVIDSQIRSSLNQLKAKVTVAELSQEHSVSPVAQYQWRSKNGDIVISMIKRLKKLELNLRAKPKKREVV